MLFYEFVQTFPRDIPAWSSFFYVLPGHAGFLFCSSQDTPTRRWPKFETAFWKINPQLRVIVFNGVHSF